MSNRIFQGLVHQMRDAVGRTLGVIDETGTIIACSELSKIGEVISTASDVFGDAELHYINNYTFCNFGSHIQTEYAVFVEGKFLDVIDVSAVKGVADDLGFSVYLYHIRENTPMVKNLVRNFPDSPGSLVMRMKSMAPV